MTFPYTGCSTCKQRHLKCDGTLPICTRCLKSKRPCDGANSSKDTLIHIHSENSYASGKRKRPRGPRPSPTVLSEPSDDDLVTGAISNYVKTDLQSVPDLPSLLLSVDDDILPIYTSHQNDPTIHLALSVLALAVYGRTHSQPRALTKACLGYQQLLQQTRSALSSSPPNSDAEIEKLLFITFCMSRYEDAVHKRKMRSSSRNFTSASHHDGSLALIRACTHSRVRVSDGVPRIVKHTRRCMIKSALLRSRDLPEWIQHGGEFGEEGPELEYDRIAVQLTILRHQLRSELQLHDSLLDDLIAQTDNLNIKLIEWSSGFPATSSHSTDEVSINKATPVPFTQGLVWLRFYSSHILILSTYISFQKRLKTTHSSPSREESSTQLHHVTQIFKSTLADILDNISSTDSTSANVKSDEKIKPEMTRWVAWPLTLILLAEEVQGSERMCFEKMMREVGRVSGFSILEDVDSVIMDGFQGC